MHMESHGARDTRFEFEPGALKQFLASNFLRSDYDVTCIESCPTYFGGVDFGSVAVFRHEGSGMTRGYRRMDHCRTDHVDDFLISLPLRGQINLMQSGSTVVVEPGHFIVCATAKPFAESTTSDRRLGTYQTHHVRVSGSMLRARIPRVDGYCHTPIKIVPGAGRAMVSMFALAMEEGHAFTESQSRSFGTMLVDAIANTLRDVPELLSLHPESRESAYARIRQMAQYFIACNISNPALGPAMVAEHCKISLRYLHAAFASNSQTLGALIRETRLQRCREALQNPATRDYSVFEIALRWGFSDQAYFSRIYKARFGKTPSSDRDEG